MQSSSVPSLLVFGGNGYVGSHVCQEALAEGIPVTSISRSGKPSNDDREWVEQVEWLQADAMHPETYSERLKSCLAVVSCIGLISTSSAAMQKVNGDANIAIINAAADAGVSRFAYISAHDYQFPGDLLVMKGYFQGKRDSESALAAKFGDNGELCLAAILHRALTCKYTSCNMLHSVWGLESEQRPGPSASQRPVEHGLSCAGVALRPGFIHGTRRVGRTQLPLSVIGAPLESVLNMMPSKSLASVPLAGAAFVPPVNVRSVAKAAVAAATDPSVPGGTMSVWDIASYK